jgi:hypothetical protein
MNDDVILAILGVNLFPEFDALFQARTRELRVGSKRGRNEEKTNNHGRNAEFHL